MEQTFVPWLKQALDTFVPYLPGPSAPALPWNALPDPIYALDPVPADPADDLAKLSLNGSSSSQVPDVYAPKGWKMATLTKNERVTASGWFQDVRELDLELDGHESYPPGSVCAIHPRCSAEEVDTFLEMNDLQAEADRPIVIRSTIPGAYSACHMSLTLSRPASPTSPSPRPHDPPHPSDIPP